MSQLVSRNEEGRRKTTATINNCRVALWILSEQDQATPLTAAMVFFRITMCPKQLGERRRRRRRIGHRKLKFGERRRLM